VAVNVEYCVGHRFVELAVKLAVQAAAIANDCDWAFPGTGAVTPGVSRGAVGAAFTLADCSVAALAAATGNKEKRLTRAAKNTN